MSPSSGLRKRILWGPSSSAHSTVWPFSRPCTTPMYCSSLASVMAGSPIVRRAVNPVETPKWMRPGASALSEARALAVTGAMRLEGIRTPVPNRMRDVCIAAAAIATNTSAFRSWLSTNQAWVKPSSSARFTTFQESEEVASRTPKSIVVLMRIGHGAPPLRDATGSQPFRRGSNWSAFRRSIALRSPSASLTRASVSTARSGLASGTVDAQMKTPGSYSNRN